jgi:hypothetical protein
VPLVDALVTFTEVETEGGVVAVPVAVTVHVPAAEGAVKRPDLLIVPHVAVHVTVAFAENCSVAFTSTVGLVGAMESVVDAPADPERVAVCGLLPAESVNTKLAVRAPEAEGVKVMVTEQLDNAIRVEPHVLPVIAKSDALAPVIAMPVMATAEAPPLLNVTDFGELVEPMATLGKATLVGETDTLPALELVPVPARDTCNDVPLAVMPRVAVRGPDDVGLNTTLMAQLAIAARLALHELFAIWKSPAFGPESAAAPSDTADALVLLNVTVWAALVLPSLVSGNEMEAGFTVTLPVAGTLPVPESVT